MSTMRKYAARVRLAVDAHRAGIGLGLIIACWLPIPSLAAGTCALSTQTLTFGSINPQSSATIYTSGTARVSCTGLQENASFSVCLAIGDGDASGSTAASRKISNGGDRIPIVIKNAPSAPLEIGTEKPFPKAGPVNFVTNGSGDGFATFPLSIALSGPVGVPPGTYSNTFAGKDFEATYVEGAQSQCGKDKANVIGGQLTVNAVVVAGCTVTASAMNFGAMAVLTSARSATSVITLSCTQGVNATVGLDNGQTGTSPVSRELRSNTTVINYGIYRDASHTFPWGQTIGSDTVGVSMGQSTSARVTAYGLAPAQGAPAAGNYTDVVSVTITY